MSEVCSLLEDVLAYARRRNGKIYAPIDHPDFAHIPCQYGPERFEVIRNNMPPGMETALDIGTHWGYFAHKLEQLGLKVTATEINRDYLKFLEKIRTLYNDSFEIYPKSIFTMEGALKFDVVLGLNIFHHFIKKEKEFEMFRTFLSRLDCHACFFQAHNPREGQMEGAFRNFFPDQFCEFLIENVPNFSSARQIADDGFRPMYLLQ